MTPDRIFYPLAALVAGALIVLAMIFPQGEGARSPGPFGHMPSQQTAAAMALVHQNANVDLEAQKAADAMKNQQTRETDPPPLTAAPTVIAAPAK